MVLLNEHRSRINFTNGVTQMTGYAQASVSSHAPLDRSLNKDNLVIYIERARSCQMMEQP